MIKIKSLVLLFALSIGFIGCGQPQFNPNNKSMVFIKGKPYKVPYQTNYSLQPLSKDDIKALRKYGYQYCSEGDIRWVSNKKDKITNPKYLNHFDSLIPVIIDPKNSKGTISEMRFKSNPNASQGYKTMMYITNGILDKLASFTSENSTFGEILKNKEAMGYLYTSAFMAKVLVGYAGCISSMSNQEYNYYIDNQRQQAQLKNQKNIKAQTNFNSLLNGLNDLSNSMSNQTNTIQKNNNKSYSTKTYNYSPPTLYTPSSSSSCSSDFDCGSSYKCVKPQYSSNGTCMKSVNKMGIERYTSPINNRGINKTKQCSYDLQCPLGFKCSSGNCIQ